MTEWERWHEGKSFTVDWTTGNFASWAAFLAPLRDREIEILEIGSWEGRSAIFFLEFFKLSRLTCVDTFLGSEEHSVLQPALATIEEKFDENTRGYGARLEKFKDRSARALDRLAQDRRGFDIIYIDGSHKREDVMADSSLAWKILKQGGFIIWDDYLWNNEAPLADRPRRGIDAFLYSVGGESKILQISYQVIAQKQACEDAAGTTTLRGWVFPRTLRNLVRFLQKKPIGEFR
jgi:predicted O-methyltransferase YrrM